ncbi:MAG: ferritin-like domain-containing protein [Gammaproteobacteria bacterium]
MKNIFSLAAACLQHNDIEALLANTHAAWRLNCAGQLDFSSSDTPQPIAATRFPLRPKLLDPRFMPRRKLTTPGGLQAFFHAIAHIEFTAIYLAWDILYRFRGMPQQFYQDWLRVADEEAQHFALISAHLRQMGIEYGDLPAHRGLWELAENTAGDLPARLALVPRYMEAHGLDVTPPMIDKFTQAGDTQSVAILTRILTDEVGHVALGTHWFHYVCGQYGLNAEEQYKLLLAKHLTGKPKKPFNRELRLKAGFSDRELKWLESL